MPLLLAVLSRLSRAAVVRCCVCWHQQVPGSSSRYTTSVPIFSKFETAGTVLYYDTDTEYQFPLSTEKRQRD